MRIRTTAALALFLVIGCKSAYYGTRARIAAVRERLGEEEFSAASKAMGQAGDDKARAKAQEEYQKLYQRRSDFMREEMTGFVWLYLQK